MPLQLFTMVDWGNIGHFMKDFLIKLVSDDYLYNNINVNVKCQSVLMIPIERSV